MTISLLNFVFSVKPSSQTS